MWFPKKFDEFLWISLKKRFFLQYQRKKGNDRNRQHQRFGWKGKSNLHPIPNNNPFDSHKMHKKEQSISVLGFGRSIYCRFATLHIYITLSSRNGLVPCALLTFVSNFFFRLKFSHKTGGFLNLHLHNFAYAISN